MILCVTGPMAAGKNEAAAILEKKGFVSVDADLLAHQAIEEEKEKILETFGLLAKKKKIELLTADGKINRKNLGAVIFEDGALIKKQEEILYPRINKLFDDFINANEGKNIVVNATLLYKVPLIKKMDCVLFVTAPFWQRLYRAKKRDGLSFKQIILRFKSQKNLFAKYKKSVADTVKVGNTGSRKCLEKKIEKFLAGRR